MNWQLVKSLNAKEAKKVRPEILNAFWEKRIESHNERSIDLIKGFIKGRPSTYWNGLSIDRDQWSSVIDAEFQQIETDHDKRKFFKLFEHISDMDILGIDKGEGFNIARQNVPKEDITVPLSSDDEREITEYMVDMNMSAAVSIVSEGKTSTLCSAENDEKSIFSIHSVGKIFTGMLVLRLVEQGILKEEDLKKPIQISERAKEKLPASVVDRLKDVTLHDVMVHQGGFGDFIGNYVKDVKSSLENKTELPIIKSLEDFLLYANDELSDHGKTRYSNLGSLLVGLATEHAYAEYQKIHSELPQLHFNDMLQEFIQKPSGMTVLTDRSPDGAKVNTSTIIAEPTPEAPYLVANPSGGYWTSVSDLRKFGEWLYDKSKKTDFSRLISEYGQEFHLDGNTLGHKGENPSASAMLSVSLTNGRVIASLSNSSRTAAHDLEETIRENIFSKPAIDPHASSLASVTADAHSVAISKRPTRSEIEERMRKGEVPGVSIAYLDLKKATPIEPVVIGITDLHASTPHVDVEQDTVFGAASLSKPVFSYLALKLIADNKLGATDKSFGLDTPLSEILPENQKELDELFEVFNTGKIKVTPEFIAEAKKITPRMILSHTSGIPIDGSPRFLFKPGTQYSYGNTPLNFLKKAIEKHMGQSLEALAQQEVFEPLKMKDSSFYPQYDIGEISESTRELGKIYLNFTDAGLQYEVKGLDKELKSGIIPASFALSCLTSEEFHRLSIDDNTKQYLKNATDSNYCRVPFTKTEFDELKRALNESTQTEIKNLSAKLVLPKDLPQDFPKNASEIILSKKKWLPTILDHTAAAGYTPWGGNAANSLRTTPTDLTLLSAAWMSDPNPIMQEAFRPQISLTEDQWAIDMGVKKNDMKHLAWGCGLGLQKNDAGEVVTAFHSGDMNQWRGWIAMDVKNKSAVVFMANGDDTKKGSGHGYGHVLADTIVAPEVDVTHVLDWFFPKFGLSRDVKDGWNLREEADTTRIDAYVEGGLETRNFLFTNTDNPTLKEISGSHKLIEAELARGDRILYVHTPPSPTEDKPPGILILMDGLQETHPGSGAQPTPAILHELYQSKEISPQVTVFIPAPENRVGEYACNSNFTKFLNDQLIPLLRSSPADGGFGCSHDREKTTVGGTSFGGLAATHAALSHPETFGNVLSQSGAFWWNEEWKGFDHPDKWASASKTAEHETTQQATAMTWLSKIPPKEVLPVNFYLSGGEIEEGKTPSLNGESFPGAITLNKVLGIRLADRGHSVTTAIRSGDHDYGSWQSDKPIALQTLLPNKPTPQLAADPGKTKQYRDSVREMRRSDPGDMALTGSSKAEEKNSALHTTPKPP